MKSNAVSVEEYLNNVAEDKKEAIAELRKVVKKNLPKGFKEVISYGMIGYVVPHSLFPAGYHCDPSLPLPFINIAAQKNFIAFYHMGLYANPALLNWFSDAYPMHSKYRLDMGKSCVRFKRNDDIPFELIAELVKKMSVEDWINLYQKGLESKKKNLKRS